MAEFWNDTFTGSALALDDGSYASDSGGNYTRLVGPVGTNLQRDGSGNCRPTANVADVAIGYVADTAPTTADQAVHLELSNVGSGQNRISHILGYASGDGYCCNFRSAATSNMVRVDDDAFTNINTFTAPTILTTDKVTFRRTGSTFTFEINDVGIGDDGIDSTYSHAGQVGIGGAAFSSFSGADWTTTNIAASRLWAEDTAAAGGGGLRSPLLLFGVGF